MIMECTTRLLEWLKIKDSITLSCWGCGGTGTLICCWWEQYNCPSRGNG